MTEMETDKMIGQFMKSHKKEIADNGFSRKVMHKLPDRGQRLANIWIAICTVVGVVLFFVFNGLSGILEILKDIVVSFGDSVLAINPIYILITVAVLTTIGFQRALASS